MQNESGKIEGDLRVTGPFTLNGMVTGSITVATGGTLHLHGMCCGTLFVESGGIAFVHGTVVQDIRNQGTVEVRGMVNGSVFSKGAHFQQVPSAVIHGAIET